MHKPADIRWVQRYENFEKTVKLFEESCGLNLYALGQLEQMGIVQLFEITFELAWKLMADKLKYEGIQVNASPRSVIKQAFASDLITEGQTWIEMIDTRNQLSHTYDSAALQKLIAKVASEYLPLFLQLRESTRPSDI